MPHNWVGFKDSYTGMRKVRCSKCHNVQIPGTTRDPDPERRVYINEGPWGQSYSCEELQVFNLMQE
jgi:hypothetical protein